jgi:hypothetical protein
MTACILHVRGGESKSCAFFENIWLRKLWRHTQFAQVSMEYVCICACAPWRCFGLAAYMRGRFHLVWKSRWGPTNQRSIARTRAHTHSDQTLSPVKSISHAFMPSALTLPQHQTCCTWIAIAPIKNLPMVTDAHYVSLSEQALDMCFLKTWNQQTRLWAKWRGEILVARRSGWSVRVAFT